MDHALPNPLQAFYRTIFLPAATKVYGELGYQFSTRNCVAEGLDFSFKWEHFRNQGS